MVFPFDKISASSPVEYSYVRFLNAAPDSSKITVFINGVEMHKRLGYKEFSGYDKAVKGTYKVKIVEHGRECFNGEIKAGKEKIYTAALFGSNKGMKLKVSEDIKREKPGESACIRFVNLLCEGNRADIYLNTVKVLSDIGEGECSKYLTVTPGGYTIAVNLCNSKDAVLDASGIHLDCGKHYGAYLIGKSDCAQMLIPLEGAAYLKF